MNLTFTKELKYLFASECYVTVFLSFLKHAVVAYVESNASYHVVTIIKIRIMRVVYKAV